MIWKILPLALLQSAFLCATQVLLKFASRSISAFQWKWAWWRDCLLTNWWLLGTGAAGLVAMVLWVYILKHFPFGIAYPLSCLSYVFGLLAAAVIFKENVAWTKWMGVFLVMSGCILIAR